MNRVVVTGMAGLCPIGNDWQTVCGNLRRKENAISYIPEWADYNGLRTHLGGRIDDFIVPEYYCRKKIRSMGRVALLATRATELALKDARLLDSPEITSGDMGISYGSGSGSPSALTQYAVLPLNRSMKGITATTYIQMMSHTCAANIGLFFELKGRVIPTTSGCTSGSQGIGYGYEAVKHGYQSMMVGGGAEELSVTISAVFDVMNATSARNETPKKTPRPFDRERDGLVTAEGAATLILEDLSHALDRGAHIYAEVVGYGTNSDGYHITNPNPKTMKRVMELALGDANLEPAQIGYISAHATGTELGDIAEAAATSELFGSSVPISSFKSYVGHTLGAAGSLEAWVAINMMNSDWYAPTINLDQIDERCANLDHITGDGRKMQNEYVMSNNFAFGGVNTSLIFKRWG